MTRFGDSKIRREIGIFDLEEPVQVEISAEGLSFWIKGSRKRVRLTWSNAVAAGATSMDVPSYLMGKPLALLQAQAAKK